MPPRHGKSELVNRNFIPWYLGRNPRHEVIGASYNSDLASDFGREIRNKFNDENHRLAFPNVYLAEDSSAANRWHTNHRGSYRAAGMDTGVTGRGANLLVIDDPHKGREEADSKIARDRVIKTYKSDFYTRLEEDAVIVLCMTRWHYEDLAAAMLELEKFTVIMGEAIDDGGYDTTTGRMIGWTKPLWPERFSPKRLFAIKKVLGEREWSALYMQKPTPDEGAFFKREHIRRYTTLPTGLKLYGTSDYAVKVGSGDYTVHMIIGVDGSYNYYLVDMWRGRTSTGDWIEKQLYFMKRYKPLIWFGEKGVIQHATEPFLMGRMRAKQEYNSALMWVPSITDKEARATPYRSAMQAGAFYLPTHSWVEPFIEEMMLFPAGPHDDMVDAAGQFIRGLMSVAPGKKDEAVKAAEQKAKRRTIDYGRGRQPEGSASWKVL
jgi:predicted phage terminase large subunit-like protein